MTKKRGKSKFTEEEVAEISELIKQKLNAPTLKQKGIRDKIRKRGFYAQDHGIGEGYTVEDFLGVITILSNDNSPMKFIIANLTWNSNDWKAPSEDKSSHRWVQDGNVPHESWNFDFEGVRNKKGRMHGYAQFTNPPAVKGDNNLLIFYSKGKIVGFYGKAEVLTEPENLTGNQSYNFTGDVEYSLVLKNKIDNIKEKGYLEDKMRIGQIGFTYLSNKETVVNILNEALALNPEEGFKINNILDWIGAKSQIPRKPLNPMNLNQILYGPPGTGKTYNSIDLAVKIADGQSYGNHKRNKERFDILSKEGQVEFVTFHQNYSYEDFMIGLRPDIDNEQLRFRQHKGVFYQIAKRARDNYLASKQQIALVKSFDEAFSDIVQPFTLEGAEVSIQMSSGLSYKITDVTDYSIHFKKPKGESHHSLSITTLQDIVEGRRHFPSGLSAYYNPLASMIKEAMTKQNGHNPETPKNYVLIIDEINRANISKVFGELITLLEDDKRLDEENELKITLPNGETDFSVPPNLYIIGTMNTADKSIALIDIALRRRFEFVGKYPDSNELDTEEAELLNKINSKIFEMKKSADYLIGHAYFMKKQPIDMVLRNSVIPLLMEYFSGKTDIISSIFEESGWSVTYSPVTHGWNIAEG